MHVSVVDNPDASVVISVRGNLDIDSAPVLTTTLDRILDRAAPRVVVDLSEVQFCDSTGLSAFVLSHNRATDTGGWLRLAGPNQFLFGLLETVGLTTRIGVYPTVAEALSA